MYWSYKSLAVSHSYTLHVYLYVSGPAGDEQIPADGAREGLLAQSGPPMMGMPYEA